MKRVRSNAVEPTRSSLDEMPEVELAHYRVRRNRFAKRIAREGTSVAHEGPSRASLKAMPEADLVETDVRRNPYARRIEAGGIVLQVGRGRPRRDAEVGPTVTRSVRLPPSVWIKLQERARAEGIAVHALVRRAIIELVDGAG